MVYPWMIYMDHRHCTSISFDVHYELFIRGESMDIPGYSWLSETDFAVVLNHGMGLQHWNTNLNEFKKNEFPWQDETDFQNASCMQSALEQNTTPIASLEIGAKSICLAPNQWLAPKSGFYIYRTSGKPSSIHACRGVAICQYPLCTWILPCDPIKTN